MNDDMIDAYIALRMEENMRYEMTPHPVEYDMYYSVGLSVPICKIEKAAFEGRLFYCSAARRGCRRHARQ